MFDFEVSGTRILAAFTALAISTATMAFAIIPASPAGLIA
ncbi:recombination protein F [Parerythrobacter jejuensis]|uniref:Recombination protein F n=1 Tax=Parerythrobacter jejuensis TaxID=795812 RepID=A0A845APZ1_9SPHN|nr:recombination protein F [Parerythrobacter jejuensis]MXP32912.1 recombination protein F [Parerythrobacter jejuensis]